MNARGTSRTYASRKLFWLLMAVSLLVSLLIHSWFDYQCKYLGTLSASVTVGGVMCAYEFQGFTKYISLEELRTRHDDRLLLEACLKEHPDNTAVCDPRYIPPAPTIKIETG